MEEVFGLFVYSHNPLLVHPHDREKLFQQHRFVDGYGVGIFQIEQGESGFLSVYWKGEVYQLRNEAFRLLPLPKFRLGDHVQTKNGTLKAGWINQVGWHFAKSKHTYYLEVPGVAVSRKEISRRYFEEDLEKLQES